MIGIPAAIGKLLAGIVMMMVLILGGCQSFHPEDVPNWAQGKLDKTDNYHVAGEVQVRDVISNEYRTYQFEERYLRPDKLRVDLFPQDSRIGDMEERQIFIADGDEVSIYHAGLKEKYQLVGLDMSQKVSFVLYHMLKDLAADSHETVIDHEPDGAYKLTIQNRRQGILKEEIFLDPGLLPTKVQVYREQGEYPEVIVRYDQTEWDTSDIDSSDFDEALLDMVYESKVESKCNIKDYNEDQ